MIRKIISGGQTGADRAALDFAIKSNIPCGGWVPKGRKAEDGRLPDRYHLQEMPTAEYAKRTEQNVIDSDGTVIVSHGGLTGGSALTREFAKQHRKHWLHVDLNVMSLPEAAAGLADWMIKSRIEVLNVAGPKASKDPRIYKATWRLLADVFKKNIKSPLTDHSLT